MNAKDENTFVRETGSGNTPSTPLSPMKILLPSDSTYQNKPCPLKVSGRFESSDEFREDTSAKSVKDYGSKIESKHLNGILRRHLTIDTKLTGSDSFNRVQKSGLAILSSMYPKFQPVIALPTCNPVAAGARILFPSNSPAVVPIEAHKVINNLEVRLRFSEQILGNHDCGLLEGLTVARETSEPKELCSDVPEDKECAKQDPLHVSDDSPGAEWKNEVKSSLHPAPLTLQLRQMKKLVDTVFPCRVTEFEKKYNQLQAWLESEHATIGQIIMSTHAKRAYVLEHERMLRQTAEKLKIFDELQHYVNSPNLADLTANYDRLQKLEHHGHILSEEAYKLNQDMQRLAQVHCFAMNSVFIFLSEWSIKMANQKVATGAKILNSKDIHSASQRKAVVFVEPSQGND